MGDSGLRDRWDRASGIYEWWSWGDDRRFATEKERLFAGMTGRCLMAAAGTGNDFRHFPPRLNIVAVDVSPEMIARAQRHVAEYDGSLELRIMDVCALDEFADATFETVATSCTFCSVPEPVIGLRELYRCLKPGGKLLMFEHVRSRFAPVAVLQDMMTVASRRIGPEMNRDTVSNVRRAGFELRSERNVYLDIVKAIEATRPL